MADETKNQNAYVRGKAYEFTSSGGRRRAAGFTRCWNLRGQMKSIHAAMRQHFVRILQEPGAIVGVENHVGRNDDPLTGVGCGRPLAIPDFRAGDGDCGIIKSVGIDLQSFQAALVGEAFDIGESLVPVDIGVAGEEVGGASHAKGVEVREVIRKGADGGE